MSASWLETSNIRNTHTQAAAVNYTDLLMLCGEYQFKPQAPFVPGSEACGKIVEIGKGVQKGFQVGDCVIVGSRIGMMQSIVDVPETQVFPLPERLTFEQGACFNVAYSTAYHCLIERAHLKSSDVVLVNGATGGVGSAALQIARRVVGCKLVIATGTSKRKLCELKDATHTIDFESTSLEDMPRILKSWSPDGQGVTVVFDVIGGKILESSLRSTKYGARVCVVGFVSGSRLKIRSNYVLIKGLTILGCRAGEALRRGVADSKKRMSDLTEWARQGRITPNVSHTFEAKHAKEAFNAVLRREVIGKAVIQFDDDDDHDHHSRHPPSPRASVTTTATTTRSNVTTTSRM